MAFNENKFNNLLNSRLGSTGFGGVSAFNEEEYRKRIGPSRFRGPLDTSKDFYSLAVQSGYKADADRVLKEKGEESNKIFSGGFISDIFDTLNSLQYGITGLLKGKGFVEGVKTRQSFSDKDSLGEYGLPGVVGGIAADILVDPLTYIAPWTLAKKISPLMKLLKAGKTAVFGEMIQKGIKTAAGANKVIGTVEGGTNAGKWVARKFVYMFGADPIYKEVYERSVVNMTKGAQNIGKLMNGIVDLPKEKMAQLLTKDDTGRFIRRPLSQLEGFTDDELFKVAENYTLLENLGKEAVEVGLLKKGVFEKNIGEYIKNAYEEYELKKGKGIFHALATKIKGIKPRKKGLTPERMKELGQIENPAYLLFKSNIDLLNDIENTKLFNKTAELFGFDEWAQGLSKNPIPRTKAYGELAGKHVPEYMFDTLTDLVRTKSSTERVLNKVVAGFKFGKVVMNPATHARNVMSNSLLNWWKLGVGPWRADLYAKALKPTKKIMDELATVGYDGSSYAANEISSILMGPATSKLGKVGEKIKRGAKKMSDLYQGEENFAKRVAYIAQREKGLGVEEAWKAAESATFNYAQVTPFVRRLRESIFGFPFITFTIKSTPVAIETALKHPQRISSLGKIKKGIESMSDIETTDRERAAEPQWVKDGFYIKLPIKDKYGRSSYFDLTYIVPFGDLMAGDFFERQVGRETGLPEGIPTAMSRKSPLFSFIREITSNQDFYGDKIWNESETSEKQLGDLFRHLSKTYLPPLVADQLPGGHIQAGPDKGTRRKTGVAKSIGLTEDTAAQRRTFMQELFRNVGIKVQPINVDIQESYMESEKKKALRTLLRDRGIISDFSKSYIPKN